MTSILELRPEDRSSENLISVILPTYNRERTLKRAVLSVLNQSYKNIELIVVDDGSNDKSKNILQELEDSRLNVILLNCRGGACNARNYGLTIARGAYIAFQDSDDVWEYNFLEILYNKIISTNSDLVFCKFNRYTGDGKMKVIPKLKEGRVDYFSIIEKSIISTQTLLAKSECFRHIKFDKAMPRLQDYDLVIRLGEKYNIYHIDQILVSVYLQSDSVSVDNDKLIVALELIKKKYQSLWVKYPKIHAKHMDVLALAYMKIGKNSDDLFLEAFKSAPTFRRCIKIILFVYSPKPIAGYANRFFFGSRD